MCTWGYLTWSTIPPFTLATDINSLVIYQSNAPFVSRFTLSRVARVISFSIAGKWKYAFLIVRPPLALIVSTYSRVICNAIKFPNITSNKTSYFILTDKLDGGLVYGGLHWAAQHGGALDLTGQLTLGGAIGTRRGV